MAEEHRKKCRAVTDAQGTQCNRKAQAGSKYCYVHRNWENNPDKESKETPNKSPAEGFVTPKQSASVPDPMSSLSKPRSAFSPVKSIFDDDVEDGWSRYVAKPVIKPVRNLLEEKHHFDAHKPDLMQDVKDELDENKDAPPFDANNVIANIPAHIKPSDLQAPIWNTHSPYSNLKFYRLGGSVQQTPTFNEMKNNQKPTFGEDNLNNRVLQTYNTVNPQSGLFAMQTGFPKSFAYFSSASTGTKENFLEKEKLMNDRINMYGRGGEVETNVQHKKGGMVTSKKK